MPLVSRKDKRGLKRLLRKDAMKPVNSVPDLVSIPPTVIPTYVKLTSATPTSSRYPAKVYERVGNDQTWTEKGTCWLEGANGETLTTGVYYLSRCVGVRAADGLPIFSTSLNNVTSSVQGWVRFTLPTALTNSEASKAACTVNEHWGDNNPGGTVTVHNPPASTGYMFAGASGAKGVAHYDGFNARYAIIQLEC